VFNVTKDTKLAFYWYSQVAESGYSTAQFNLAELYDSGVGTEKNLKQAIFWYAKAAQQGFIADHNAHFNRFDSNRSNPIATPEHCGREFCRFDKKSLSIATGVLPKTKRLLISYSKHF
jgi:hypothetical protein